MNNIKNKKKLVQIETIKVYLISMIIILLSGCSLLSPVKNDRINYVIGETPGCLLSRGSSHLSILVLQPRTVAVYNTQQMAYTLRPYQIAYFSKNQWAETPSQMLHPLIVNALENTNFFQAVITPPFVGHYDYVLSTQVIMLLQDFTCHPPLLKLIVRALLAKTSTNRVIATQEFVVEEPMRQRAPYAGVFAANRATATFLNELAQFVLGHSRGHSPLRPGEG
jgi:cholesterol transport system auxiliary component